MTITTIGLENIAVRIGSNITSPSHLGIGSGSGVVLAANTGLVFHLDRNALTSTNMSGAQEIAFTADFTNVEMSGINLREFGIFNLNSGGKLWQREGFAAVNFDGTNELQIITTWRIV